MRPQILLLAAAACMPDVHGHKADTAPDTARDTDRPIDTYGDGVFGCDRTGQVSFLPYLYGTAPVYYRDNFSISAEWSSEPLGAWIGEVGYQEPVDVRVRSFYLGFDVTTWSALDGRFRPDSRIQFTVQRCVDPASGFKPRLGSVAVFTSHVGTPVPASVVDGTTWAFDFPYSLAQVVTQPNTDRLPLSSVPMFSDRIMLLRFDAASDAEPAVVTQGWADRRTGSQDLCTPTRVDTLDRPWGEEAWFDPMFGEFTFLNLGRASAPWPRLDVMNLSIFGTFEPDGGRIAFPRWRMTFPPDESFDGRRFNCEEDPQYCEPCPDGTGRMCMEHMENAIDAWRSPTPLIDRPPEVVALDPGCVSS